MFNQPPQGEYLVASTMDPAIDGRASDLEKYGETLSVSHLTLKPGETLTLFTLRTLSTSQRAEARAEVMAGRLLGAPAAEGKEEPEGATYEQIWAQSLSWVRRALVKTKGFLIDGVELEVVVGDDGLVTMETIDKLLDPELVHELASYAREVNQCPPAGGGS